MKVNIRYSPSTDNRTVLNIYFIFTSLLNRALNGQLNGSVKEPNKFHIYETEKISRKASDAAEYIELFGSFSRDRPARRI